MVITCESSPITAMPVPSAMPAVTSGSSSPGASRTRGTGPSAAARKPKPVPPTPWRLAQLDRLAAELDADAVVLGRWADGDHALRRARRQVVRLLVEGDVGVGDLAVARRSGRRARVRRASDRAPRAAAGRPPRASRRRAPSRPGRSPTCRRWWRSRSGRCRRRPSGEACWSSARASALSVPFSLKESR